MVLHGLNGPHGRCAAASPRYVAVHCCNNCKVLRGMTEWFSRCKFPPTLNPDLRLQAPAFESVQHKVDPGLQLRLRWSRCVECVYLTIRYVTRLTRLSAPLRSRTDSLCPGEPLAPLAPLVPGTWHLAPRSVSSLLALVTAALVTETTRLPQIYARR